MIIYLGGSGSPDKYTNFGGILTTSITTAGYFMKLNKDMDLVFIKTSTSNSGYRGFIKSIVVDEDDNVYATGGAATFNQWGEYPQFPGCYTGYDPMIIKTDALGNYLWLKRYPCSASDGAIKGLSLDSNSNLYITGKFKGTLELSGSDSIISNSSDYDDSYLIKINTDTGEYIWYKHIRGPNSVYSNTLTVESDNVYISGYRKDKLYIDELIFDQSASDGQLRGYIIKLNGNGNIIWAKSIESLDLSGSHYQIPFKLNIDKNNNIYLYSLYIYGLKYDGQIVYANDTQYKRVSLIKINSNGDIIWSNSSYAPSSEGSVSHDIGFGNTPFSFSTQKGFGCIASVVTGPVSKKSIEIADTRVEILNSSITNIVLMYFNYNI